MHRESDLASSGQAADLVASTLSPDHPEGLSFEALRNWLIATTAAMLENDRALLMSHLYRLDVAEEAVRSTLSHAPPAEIPSRLADLMIERQLQKIRLRRTYSNDS